MLKKLFKSLLLILPLAGLIGFTGYRVREAMKAKDQPAAPGGGGGSGGGMGGMGGGGRGGGGAPGGGARVQTVQTGAVSSGKISEKIELTGSLKSKERVDVNPKMQGRILRVVGDTGQPVARGALVAVLEDDEIKQQIERSQASIAVVDATIAQREAELSNAKADLDRKRKLVEEGLLTRQELDSLETRQRVSASQLELARAQRRQSEAEQRELNIRLSQTRVYSPLNGVVAKRHLDVGAMASSGTPIITVVSLNPMVIEAQASERDIARIRRGTSVAVTVDSLPGQKFSGRVMRISPLLDAQTRNGMVEIEIANRGGALKAEMFARIQLDLGSSRDTTLLPRDALVYRGDKPGVYIIEAEKAKFLAVETGLTQENQVEVINGLKPGDTVITQGANLLKDGDRVRVAGKGGPGGGGPGGGGPGGPQTAQTQGGPPQGQDGPPRGDQAPQRGGPPQGEGQQRRPQGDGAGEKKMREK